MGKFKAALDRLPTALRDFLVAFVAISAALVLQAVVGAGGVTGVNWPDVLLAALNAGAVASAGVGLLAVTTLTTAYGRGRTVPGEVVNVRDERPGEATSDVDPFHRPI